MNKNLLECIKHVLDDKQANHIVVLDFEQSSPFYDHFVIADASNSRQLNALADYVVEAVEQQGFPVHHTERTESSDWILIDCYDVVVHLFLKEQRATVQLEKLWRDYVREDVI